MKYYYDLHIHSGLSPCADNDMSPINIVAAASAKGLDIIAISDHNSIKNVGLAMEIGKMLKVLVIPAMELQTNEDIHILCLFATFADLEKFYNSIEFTTLQNNVEVFGNQYIYDGDDNIAGEEKSLLVAGANISESEVMKKAADYNGIAIPAHIDRDACGMLAVLGAIPKGYTAVELSRFCPKAAEEEYSKEFNIIFNSDAHTLKDIGAVMKSVDLPMCNPRILIDYLLANK